VAASTLVVSALTAWLVSAVGLSIIDLRTRTLPTRIIWAAAGAVWLLYTAAALLAGRSGPLAGAALGALAASAPLALIHLIHPPSMGFGDVRFAVLNGMVCGWWGWHVALGGLAAGFGAALPEAVAVMIRHGARTSRPLGPYLAIGAGAAAWWGAATYGIVPSG